MAGVDVISSCLVGMLSITTSMSRLELTPFDLQILPYNFIQRAILFRKPQFQQIDKKFIDNLKNSLSRTLDFFPPLAGRLTKTPNDDGTASFFVDCSNEGVAFTHAVAASISISDILEPKYVPEIVSSLFALNGILSNYEGVSKPLIGVQVTEIADGISIACTANHAVIDGVSFWHFFNSWSEISRGIDPISKSPVFDRWFPSNADCPIRVPPWEKGGPLRFPPLQTRVFHFSKGNLTKLKSKANSEAGTEKISALQALSAHLWRNCMRCRRKSLPAGDLRGGEPRFFMGVSARARIPLAEGYFGNAAYGAGTAINEEELLQNRLGDAALKISETVAMQTRARAIKIGEAWAGNPVLRERVPIFSFSVSSSPRHDVYGNDFGWGKPIAVRSGTAQKFDGNTVVFPAPAADGGIDVEVTLRPEVLQAMEGDAEFMEAFTSEAGGIAGIGR